MGLVGMENGSPKVFPDLPEPFVWTAHADAIIAKVNRCKAQLETLR